MATRVLQRIREFIPESGKGKEDGQEPIKVFLRPVDVYTKQTHIRKFLGKKGPELMQDMMSKEGSDEIKGILQKCIVRIEGLETNDEPTKEEIALAKSENRRPKLGEPRLATFEDVWAMGEWQLCLEIFTNILNSSQLSSEETKNSNSQSGLPPTPEAQVH